jgi:aspartate-semialdehyde dehydrogenase
VPLVVPEVNPEAIAQYRPRGIIANPNCSTMQMLVALKPIHARRHRAHQRRDLPVGVRREAARRWRNSAADRRAAELPGADPKKFPVQIAFNLIPHIDVFLDNGYTKEEMKLVWETRKILGDDTIQVNPTAVRVPVFYGHSEAVTSRRARRSRRRGGARTARGGAGRGGGRRARPAVIRRRSPMPRANDPVYVGRIREDISHPRAEPLGGLRQHPQGRRAQRGADRRVDRCRRLTATVANPGTDG